MSIMAEVLKNNEAYAREFSHCASDSWAHFPFF